MRAAIWRGARDIAVGDAAEPELVGGDAIVAVDFCGLCGSDLGEFTHGPRLIRTKPHPLTGDAPPFPLGHEISGTVVAVANGIDVAVGTRVAVDPCWRCGTCYWCKRGDYHLCRVGGAVGLASAGGLAERVRVPAVGLVPLPAGLSTRRAALAEPFAVALHATDRSGARPGDTAIVVGCGPIGAAITICLVAAGVTVLLAADGDTSRAELVRSLGARTIRPAVDREVVGEVRSWTEGVGADVAFDCTGASRVVSALLPAVRKGGRLVVVGVCQGEVPLDGVQLVMGEKDVVGSAGYRFDVERAVALLASAAGDAADALLTTEVVLDDVPTLFERLAAGDSSTVKALVRP